MDMVVDQAMETQSEALVSASSETSHIKPLAHSDRSLDLDLDLDPDLGLRHDPDLDVNQEGSSFSFLAPLDLSPDLSLESSGDLPFASSPTLLTPPHSLHNTHQYQSLVDLSLIDPALVDATLDPPKPVPTPSLQPSLRQVPHALLRQSLDPSLNPQNESHKKEEKRNPDPGYVKMYEDYTSTYFGRDYLETQGKLKSFHRLKPSKITTSRSYYVDKTRPDYAPYGIDPSVLEKKEHDETQYAWLPGSWWSADEKETFFRCLARYSIHRVSEWCHELFNKSETEILMYYNLLQKELSRVKRKNHFKVSFEDYLPNETAELILVPHIYETDYYFKGSSYASLPIAYELTEEWIKYEEEQASLLARKEESQNLRYESAQRKRIATTTGLHLDIVQKKDQFSILHLLAALKLSHLYRKNTIFPCSTTSNKQQMNIGVMLFLDEFARQKVREIISNLIAQRACGNTGEGSKVSTVDIWKTCLALNMFQTPKAGLYSRDRDGKLPIMANYWENIVLSLNLPVEGGQSNVRDKKLKKDYKKLFAEESSQIMHIRSRQPEEIFQYDTDSLDFTAHGNILESNDDLRVNEQLDLAVLEVETEVDSCSKKRTFNDVLVEEMCIQQETFLLRLLDSKRDRKQFDTDMKYFAKSQIPPVGLVVPNLDFDDLDSIRFWGPTNVEKLCPEKLRKVWDHSFAQYRR